MEAGDNLVQTLNELGFEEDETVAEFVRRIAKDHDDAVVALSEIAKMCGSPEWDYPRQVARDVERAAFCLVGDLCPIGGNWFEQLKGIEEEIRSGSCSPDDFWQRECEKALSNVLVCGVGLEEQGKRALRSGRRLLRVAYALRETSYRWELDGQCTQCGSPTLVLVKITRGKQSRDIPMCNACIDKLFPHNKFGELSDVGMSDEQLEENAITSDG